ncbi:cytochrome P450 [Streptomyces sp. WI04-05B]|uniref:cytochrome P450 n=1 Tax=Streptomyces TaxID=1883 RepID=UPI0029A8345B|nr:MULTISPECIES: cytochrome P450 [unclassified Streptomyces]MDX2545373.1 cytochrome P450 [Streptomyces sp. WI04-05B]MDX2588132.1 cytochrome P450 [Streptomyces sp. WI04-05A]MDX3749107.1 cytochrome P450 [Streptomyces sp. AK08-02]
MTEPTPRPVMPFRQPQPLLPSPELRDLQQRCPVHRVRTRTGDEAWLVTGHDEVRSLYAGDRLGRSHPRPERAARLTASALFGGRPREHYGTEDADRQWMRQVLHTVMSPARLRELRPWLDATVTELLDRFEAAPRPADLVDLIAVPLPTLVICRLLGVPAKDLARYRELADAIASAGDEQLSGQGLAELTDGLRELVAAGRVTADGLLGRLRAAPYRLPPGVVADIGAAMMFTGHHTTVVAIGYGTLLLMTNPEQRAAVLADPDKLPAAVEECLRIGNAGVNVGGGNGIPTYAREDFELADVCVRAGDLVLLDTGSANHDETVFDDAHRFVVDRPANQHLTFGYGRHYCPGAGLARVEMSALFAQLLPRFPQLRPAVGLHELRAHDDQITGGLAALPVTW